MPFYSEEYITRVKDANPIEEVIGERVSLRKAGKNMLGLCPFHFEKTPSFNVRPDRGFYHCFGCHKGGNVFQFLMEYEGLTFPESVEYLSRRAGIPVEGGPSSEAATEYAATRKKSKNRLYELYQFATGFYTAELRGSNSAKAARDYLTERDISEETQRAFMIGFAPDEWEILINAAKKKGFTEQELVRSGLVIERDSGGMYDRFRNRIIFPIWDLTGRVIAFGGRTISDDTPKYINSPETPIYQKSDVLYPLYHTKHAIQKKKMAVLCEGYFDAIMLAQHRFTYAVASCGTALTQEQAHLLARFTKKVTMAYDGDAAGQEATVKSMAVLIAEGLDVFVAPLDSGDDPDSLLRRGGRDAFENACDNAKPFFPFLMQHIANESGTTTPQERREFLNRVFPVMAGIDDEFVQSEYCNELADYLDVETTRVQRAFDGYKNTQQAVRRERDSHTDKSTTYSDQKAPTPAEQLFLVLTLRNEEALEYAYTHCDISFIEHPTVYAIIEKMYELFSEEKWSGLDSFLSEIDEENASFLTECISKAPDDDATLMSALKDCIRTLHCDKYKTEQQRLREELRESTDTQEILDIMNRIKKYDTLIQMQKQKQESHILE